MNVKTAIPLYRARRKDNGKWVEGCLIKYPLDDGFYWAIQFEITWPECIDYDRYEERMIIKQINPNTLAIHFPDMLDKHGEKIWAALNESRVGGSKVSHDYQVENSDGLSKYERPKFVKQKETLICHYRKGTILFRHANSTASRLFDLQYPEIEVTGIYEGETDEQ